MRHLQKDDAVITPLGRTAVVVEPVDAEGYVELEYVDEPAKHKRQVKLLETMLCRIRKGRELPQPVRIGRAVRSF